MCTRLVPTHKEVHQLGHHKHRGHKSYHPLYLSVVCVGDGAHIIFVVLHVHCVDDSTTHSTARTKIMDHLRKQVINLDNGSYSFIAKRINRYTVGRACALIRVFIAILVAQRMRSRIKICACHG